MAESASDEFLRPYREAVARHGPGFEATLWGSRDAQLLRFDIMIDMGGLDGCSILDLGCGRGDFAVHLLGRDIAFTRYAGIDAIQAMIDDARARTLERCRFEVADLLAPDGLTAGPPDEGPPDFACISGALNTMDDTHARHLVEAAFSAASQGVIFNFLSNRPHERLAGRDLTPARRFDTVAWLDWALGRSSRVCFRQDYLDGHDATIMIRHE